MGTLDFVLNEVENKFDIPDANAKSLLSGLLGFINQQARGLAGVLDRIREAGLGDPVSSWLGGEPKPISPEGLETALGGRAISNIASKAGLPVVTASSALAFMLPKIVQRLTKGGNVPTSLPTEFSSYIAGPAAAVESGVTERARTLEKGRFHRILWPILAMALLALLGLWIGHSRGAIFDAAKEVQLATQRATSALAALAPGFTAFDLVDALNLDVINFAPGSADIPTDSYDFLNKAAVAIMAAPPGTVIGITGNTDNTGDPDSNMQLSQERALAVRDYLVARGVDGAALTVAGNGDRNPVAGNDTEEGRFRNRRIQFSVAN
jgi:outer membrane protein OmpA-like peptidoglycan-associated protein/uncharacterized protein YidB (DUF937 family)